MNGDFINDLRKMSKVQREEQIQAKIHEAQSDLMDTEIVAGEIASSNATGWDLDECEVLSVSFGPTEARAKIAFVLSGEQDDDKPFSGTKIKGEAVAIFDAPGEVMFEIEKAERDLGAD
jgi:hypothetical protein